MITASKLKNTLYHATNLMSWITSNIEVNATFSSLVKRRLFRQRRHNLSSAAIILIALALGIASAAATENNVDKCKDKYYQESAKAKTIKKNCLRKSKSITLAKDCNHAYSYRLSIENNNKYNCMTAGRGN